MAAKIDYSTSTMKKYYYHITTRSWPKNVLLKPRKYGANRADEEPKTARICVAPTIEGCLIALGSCLPLSSDLYIYRTVRKINAIKPIDVIDSEITEEMWLLRPINFKYVGKIKKKTLPEHLYWLDVGRKEALNLQKKYKKILKKNIKSHIT